MKEVFNRARVGTCRRKQYMDDVHENETTREEAASDAQSQRQ
jgi:hypothetical protein